MSKINSKYLITGKLLARNTILNFIGQVLPLIVAVITLPFIIRGLGTERFGLLSLAWVVLGYFTIFDLGLGRATTKFIAEALGKGEPDQVSSLVWTAVVIQMILSSLGVLVLINITPFLVERILNIPPELTGEARNIFYLLAVAIPLILITSSFSGVLEAAQRFDLLNAVRVPSSISTYLLTLIGLALGFQLTGIVVLILIARFGTLLALIILAMRIFPKIRKFSLHFVLFPRLFTYGVWIMVSNVVSPILMYLDRFLIASLLSVAAVAYYTVPYEALTRLWIIPGSLIMSLFPAFSALGRIEHQQRIEALFARSIKYTLLILGPIILVLALFSEDILTIWVGADFAIQSTVIMQILAFGVLINSIANIPYALLQGVGRPDIIAKFHLLELPLYMGTAWFLINRWGITGAAAAWTIRVLLDAILLFAAAFRIGRFSQRLFITDGSLLGSLALILFGLLTYGLKILTNVLPLFIQVGFLAILFTVFGWVVWRNVLDNLDRDTILKAIKLHKAV